MSDVPFIYLRLKHFNGFKIVDVARVVLLRVTMQSSNLLLERYSPDTSPIKVLLSKIISLLLVETAKLSSVMIFCKYINVVEEHLP